MAATAISDIVEPTVFTAYLAENTPEKLVMLQNSGILTPPDAEMASRFGAGGRKIEVPYWEDLDRDEPEGIDDSDDDIEGSKLTADDMTAMKHRMAKYHVSKTLAGYVATGKGESPMNRVAERIGAYWAYVKEQRIIKTAQGVIAGNVANDDSDMVYSVYSDLASPTASNRISYQAVNHARLTMGEMLDDLRVIAMHTNVYGTLLDDEQIDFIQPSNLPFKIPTYAGMTVLHSENFPVTTGTNSDSYRCFLFAAGAFLHIDEVPTMPTQFGTEGVEIIREPKSGNGGGQDGLLTRRFELLHPAGMEWTSSSLANNNYATWAELATAANWTRKWDRKNVKLAALDVNV